MKQRVFYKNLLLLSTCLLSTSTFAMANESSENDRWDGKQYVNNSNLQYQWATSYIQKLQLQGTETLLDIGCGDGRVTAVMAQTLPDGLVVGVDASDSMLQVAQELKYKTGLNNLDFIKRDALNLGFNNAFDYIVSFSCFHWIPDHFVALKEAAKALKPGGKVFLYFTPDHGLNRIDHAIDAIMASPKWAHYFSDFSNPFSLVTALQFIAYAEKAGLLLKRFENIVVEEIFPNKETFAAWMSAWLSQLKQLPKESHSEFLDEIIDYYLKNHPLDAENKLHYVGYWAEVELYKPN